MSGQQHPRWCERQHGETPAHTAEVGEVELGDGRGFAIGLAHFPGRPAPEVSVVLWGPDNDTVVDLTRGQSRTLGQLLVDAADRLTGTPSDTWLHVLRPHKPYPGGFAWSCRCGEYLLHPYGEDPAVFHARAMAHVNGEDGKPMCHTGCGRVLRNCVGCPEVTR